MVKILGEYDLVGAPRKRAKGPKARTGCLSCKIRHVKCDERKPECLRCEKFGCKCEGYATAPPKTKPKATLQVLLPKISAQFQPIFYQPSDNKFQNNEENRYFKLFCDGMAPHLAGHVTCDFWTRIVLQACDSDASIRYAVIALAALKSTSETKASSHAWTDEEQLKANAHHQFAIKSYSKAVRHMRNAALGGDNDLRSTLINCMVLVCFESFHGDHRSAAKQIGIGLSLIEDHLMNQKHSSHTDPVIENELLAAFGQLEIQALTFGESRSRESHLRLADIGEDRVKSMPITFADFSEALLFFEVIQQRLFHFMAGVLVVTCRGCLTLDNALSLDVKDLPKRDRYLGDYTKWHNAFETLLKEARQSGDRDSLFFASSMQLLYLTGYVAAVMVRDSDHEYPETRKLMPMFTQMLALSKSVMKYSPEDPGKSNFKIGMQIICPLYSVARRCPHRATRKEAISILLSHHRREGLWDSMLAGKFGEWIMELEEENYQGDYIPENLRCTGMTLISCNMVLRRAHVRGLVPNGDGTELIPREKIITW